MLAGTHFSDLNSDMLECPYSRWKASTHTNRYCCLDRDVYMRKVRRYNLAAVSVATPLKNGMYYHER